MAEIIRVYEQELPRMKFVGRRYGEDEKENGTFSAKWEEWFRDNLFAPLALGDDEEPFEDCDAYYGLCRIKPGEPFCYWIGVFMPPDAPVPDGYDSVMFEAGKTAVCWVHGKEPDIYFCDSLGSLKEHGYEWVCDKDGIKWCFERYVCPRFTVPDAEGNVTLDMCFYIEHTL